ncbi:menaquinone biosynthesis decarboxylase [Helicobacter equorum]|uniref:menaquinone biosynthesis decarboxylase n=1 Tax=Helicobacter equorum TaxID=361872 RepID=UPI000CF143CD|nr:menaquinone biosynthesis decarboxylase [Helicobacter equorum]
MENFHDTHELIKYLQTHDALRIIDTPLDIYLEIPHLAYLEVKKSDSKALLFTHPVDKKANKTFDIPVLMNVFGSHRLLTLLIQKDPNAIAKNIAALLKFTPPKGAMQILQKAKELFALRHVFPKKISRTPPFQERIQQEINLYELPILTTWEHDGGPFITMGQVYTQSLDGKKKNLGMYRLQIYDKNHLGLHWQIHKDSHHFFHEYKKAGQKMPVSIALGGDPLYIWCGQAPLPMGMYELMLYGFIRGKKPRVSKCLTNDLYVPCDVDIVIEGWVDTNTMCDEGPFGDHTGFYTPIESYPVLEVSAITMKKNPIFPATVVGKPPLEDKYMGYLTERIFLPLLQMTTHGLEDYHMPENGVFHNLIFAKLAPQYPAHAMQLMHAFWGVGQMSFVKHAIFVDENAPDLQDYEAFGHYVLNRFSTDCMLISEGVCDALDHSSPNFARGGKLGVQAMGEEIDSKIVFIQDMPLHNKIQELFPFVEGVKQYFPRTYNPLCVWSVQKQSSSLKTLISATSLGALAQNVRIVFLVDCHKNNLSNPYMLVWRITNNIDAKRDIWVQEGVVLIDATDKNALDGYHREWPKETDCSKEVIQGLQDKGLLEGVDLAFLRHYQICGECY